MPVATLKRRVDGLVAVDARLGPSTVLTRDEEDKLCQYCLDMADMEYGLTIEDTKVVAYVVQESPIHLSKVPLAMIGMKAS